MTLTLVNERWQRVSIALRLQRRRVYEGFIALLSFIYMLLCVVDYHEAADLNHPHWPLYPNLSHIADTKYHLRSGSRFNPS